VQRFVHAQRLLDAVAALVIVAPRLLCGDALKRIEQAQARVHLVQRIAALVAHVRLHLVERALCTSRKGIDTRE